MLDKLIKLLTPDPWEYVLSDAPDGRWVLAWVNGPGVIRVFRTKGHWFPYDPTHTIMYHWGDKDVKAWRKLPEPPCYKKVYKHQRK